jgi:hypothetical protein
MIIKWVDHRYGSGASAELASGLNLSVSWDASKPKNEPGRYTLTVFGVRMTTRYTDMDDAKLAGIARAKRLIHQASCLLEDEGPIQETAP